VRIQLTPPPLAGTVAKLESAAREALVEGVAGDLAAALGSAIDGEFVSPTQTNVLTARK
jgi:hypothetical protein